MNQENDVRELRVKHIVHGFFGDEETLEFFKSLTPILYLDGQAYLRIIVDLEAYRQKRRAWIAVYSFLYNNAKTIATVLSIVGVLVGIFKALYSLKKHQM
jgi:prolipoprotein diacylglyceryltransferase